MGIVLSGFLAVPSVFVAAFFGFWGGAATWFLTLCSGASLLAIRLHRRNLTFWDWLSQPDGSLEEGVPILGIGMGACLLCGGVFLMADSLRPANPRAHFLGPEEFWLGLAFHLMGLGIVGGCLSVWTVPVTKHRALARLKSDIDVQPYRTEPLLRRAAFFLAENEILNALADLDAAIELDPKNAEAYRLRSLVYAHTGDAEKARLDSDKAAELAEDA